MKNTPGGLLLLQQRLSATFRRADLVDMLLNSGDVRILPPESAP